MNIEETFAYKNLKKIFDEAIKINLAEPVKTTPSGWVAMPLPNKSGKGNRVVNRLDGKKKDPDNSQAAFQNVHLQTRPDNFFYHTTPTHNVKNIEGQGVVPKVIKNAYDDYSKNKAFIGDRNTSAIMQHDIASHHRRLKTFPKTRMSVLRIPRRAVDTDKLTQDHNYDHPHNRSYVSTEPIKGDSEIYKNSKPGYKFHMPKDSYHSLDNRLKRSSSVYDEAIFTTNLNNILNEHKSKVIHPKFSDLHLDAAVDAMRAKNQHHGYKTPDGMYSEKGLYKASNSEGRLGKKL